MKKIIFICLFVTLAINTHGIAKENACSEYKKFSPKLIACKAKLLTGKTLSKGKNFINETKEYQKKAWSKKDK